MGPSPLGPGGRGICLVVHGGARGVPRRHAGVEADAGRAVRHGWPGRFRPTGAIFGGPGVLRSLAPPPDSPPARVELLRSAIGSKVETMARKEHWKTDPDEHDYPAAHDYLTLVM